MNSNNHITFFTPTLNRTGSEWVLINLLKHERLNSHLRLIAKFKGSLYDHVPSGIAKSFLYTKQYGGLGSKIRNKFRSRLVVNKILSKHNNSVWYINTIVLPDILELAEKNKIRTIVHVHELQQMYSALTQEQIKRLVDYPELIIANSNASAEVIKNYGRNGRIEIVYPSLNEILMNKKSFVDKRAELNIPKDTFVWVMAGTLDHNKDPDLFVAIAEELKKLTPNFRMLWLGAKSDSSNIDLVCDELLPIKDLEEQVMFLGDVKDEFYDYFYMANGFVLTSKFESFSMTTLEALYLQLPIIANDCLGVNEVIGNECGYIVKQKSDPKEFAQKMFEIMKKPDVDKEKLRQRALSFNIGNISQKWNNVLNTVI